MKATYSVKRTGIDPNAEYGPSDGDVRIYIVWNYAYRVANGWSEPRLQNALETAAERLSDDQDCAVIAGTATTSGDLRLVIQTGSDDPQVTVVYHHAASQAGPSDADLLTIGKAAFTAINRAI